MGGPPPGAGGEVGGVGGEVGGRKPLHTRTDFIVLVIWREPTPSDGLMKEAPLEPDSTGGGGGFGHAPGAGGPVVPKGGVGRWGGLGTPD
jgi:hypothetical protein